MSIRARAVAVKTQVASSRPDIVRQTRKSSNATAVSASSGEIVGGPVFQSRRHEAVKDGWATADPLRHQASGRARGAVNVQACLPPLGDDSANGVGSRETLQRRAQMLRRVLINARARRSRRIRTPIPASAWASEPHERARAAERQEIRAVAVQGECRLRVHHRARQACMLQPATQSARPGRGKIARTGEGKLSRKTAICGGSASLAPLHQGLIEGRTERFWRRVARVDRVPSGSRVPRGGRGSSARGREIILVRRRRRTADTGGTSQA